MRKIVAVMTAICLMACAFFPASAAVSIPLDFPSATFRLTYSHGSTAKMVEVTPEKVAPGSFVYRNSSLDFDAFTVGLIVEFDQPIISAAPGETYSISLRGSYGYYSDTCKVIFYNGSYPGGIPVEEYYLDVSSSGFNQTLSFTGFDDPEYNTVTAIGFWIYFAPSVEYRCRFTIDEMVLYDYSVSGAIDQQTGQLDHWINDYESPRPGMEEEVQGAEDEYNNAVDDALGGKTDEEIQQEAEAAADYDFDSLDQVAVSGVQGFMNSLLNVLGTDYLSLLLFSCTMGLCIYVIGRRRGT